MEGQQKKAITGYRDLTDQEVQQINDVKDLAQDIERLLQLLESLGNVDKRWLAIGRTDLQKGFMAVVRAIAKPTTF